MYLREKKTYTNDNLLALRMIEQLKRLQYSRRFSGDEITEKRLQLNRELYIEMIVGLAKRARYNKRRTLRLAHEVNRGFKVPMTPEDAHTYTLELLGEEQEKVSYESLITSLSITNEELKTMLGSNYERIASKEEVKELILT